MLTESDTQTDRIAQLQAFVDDFPTQKKAAEAVGVSESSLSKALNPATTTDGRLRSLEGAVARWKLQQQEMDTGQERTDPNAVHETEVEYDRIRPPGPGEPGYQPPGYRPPQKEQAYPVNQGEGVLVKIGETFELYVTLRKVGPPVEIPVEAVREPERTR